MPNEPLDPRDASSKGWSKDNDRTPCLVVHPHLKQERGALRSPEARLEECVGLALAIHVDVVHSEVVNIARPKPATLFGQGVVESLATAIGRVDKTKDEWDEGDIGLAIVDAALSPIQQRNLEKAWNCKVIDRTGLILEIFGERARTAEGTLQVELAALTYQRSRLVRSWTHLERQRGGLGFIGGPGESQIEIDRRLIDERIVRLKKDLNDVRRTRELHRKSRRNTPYPVVALVGYTNAGKSTLFNRLTKAKVFAEDLLFATLDPTMRSITLPSGRDIILSDTVGFISELPHELVAAFHATLEEVHEADVILHVRDASHPDTEAQRTDVLNVLKTLGVDIEGTPDGAIIKGGDIGGGTVESFDDHRIAMSFAIASLRSKGTIVINDCANVATSFPGFVELAQSVGIKVEKEEG